MGKGYACFIEKWSFYRRIAPDVYSTPLGAVRFDLGPAFGEHVYFPIPPFELADNPTVASWMAWALFTMPKDFLTPIRILSVKFGFDIADNDLDHIITASL